MKIVSKWLDLFPVCDFEGLNHLVDVEMVREAFFTAKLPEDFANTGEESAKLQLEGLVSECWHLSARSNHLFEVMEVLVRFNKLIKGQHGRHVDAVHFWVDGLDVFDVKFVPLFASLKQILLPSCVGLESAVLLHC